MNKSRARLLYIEDYPVIQTIYVDVLKKHGFDVTVANDGKEALDMIKAGAYDIILIDLLLPGVSGLEILEQYRELNQHARVIILTDFDDPDTVRRVKDLGFPDYWLRVDNTPHFLVERLERLLK